MGENQVDDQIAEFKEPFSLFNPEGDGSVPYENVGPVLRSLLGKNPTERELKQMIAEVDPENKGKLDFPDFLSLTASLMKETTTEEDLIEAFKVFDRDGEGLD